MKHTVTALFLMFFLVSCTPEIIVGTTFASAYIATKRKPIKTMFSDTLIFARIKSQLLTTRYAPLALSVDMTIQNGTVYLLGYARTEQAKTYIISTAKGTDGVKSVVDEIKIQTPSIGQNIGLYASDSFISLQTEVRTLFNQNISWSNVYIKTINNNTYLIENSSLNSNVAKVERENSAAIASRSFGVKKVILYSTESPYDL